jgi:NAD(P)-dependent dehydrogenase (short-subunit alcohol dehydrogenase family)
MNKSIAIVTGGSSGLGFEIAKYLIKRGKNTCIVGRSEEKLKNAVSLLRSHVSGAELLSFKANVGNEKEVKALFDFIEGKSARALYA